MKKLEIPGGVFYRTIQQCLPSLVLNKRVFIGATTHAFRRTGCITTLSCLLGLGLFSASVAAEEAFKSEIQKASYGVGTKYGEGLKRDLDDLDLDAFVKGIRDAFAGKELALDSEQLNQAVAAYQQRKMAEAKSAHLEKAQKNLASGQAFLEENKKKKGVKVTDSGLQYKVVTEGSGKKPGAEDRVKVHYHGTLIDGTVFDSSVDRGEPMVFPVNGVIKGWTEALQLMTVGSKWKVFIPYDLAYGERGTRGVIGPNATLIFDVELIDIES